MELNSRTHVLVGLANPYLICEKCRAKVPYWHNPDRCDCNDEFFNAPCGDKADTISTCSSWSPVDGCSCTDKCK